MIKRKWHRIIKFLVWLFGGIRVSQPGDNPVRGSRRGGLTCTSETDRARVGALSESGRGPGPVPEGGPRPDLEERPPFRILDSLFSFKFRLCYISRHVSSKAINTRMIYVLADHPINGGWFFGAADSSEWPFNLFSSLYTVNQSCSCLVFFTSLYGKPSRFYILLHYYLHNLRRELSTRG